MSKEGKLQPGMTIAFEMNEDKALEALVWLAYNQPGIDAFHVSKVLYFADKEHLNRYGRPILGDTYIRMEYGPVPSQTYDLIKKASPRKNVPKKLREAIEVREGFRHLYPRRKPKMEMFSRTDRECLIKALEKYGSRDFGVLSKISHKQPAWKNAQENGTMDYEDMIEQSPKREEIIQNLKEYSRQIAF